MTTWIEVRAELDQAPSDWGPLAHIFAQHGLEGTVQHDEPPGLSAYLPPSEASRAETLARDLRSHGVARVTTSEIVETDWAEAWKQFFVPRRIGERIMLVPSWENYTPEPRDLVITLDPGQAFGTGDHPTTRLCLELLETSSPEGTEVADIGCGSGVLAIAALLLGARTAFCIDVDAGAVETTRENAARNGVELEAHVGEGFVPLGVSDPHPLAELREGKGPGWLDDASFAAAVSGHPVPPNLDGRQFDLVLSNIISAAILRLADSAAERTRPGGKWIISGVIEANWPDVRAKVEGVGFALDTLRQEAEWIAARFRRR